MITSRTEINFDDLQDLFSGICKDSANFIKQPVPQLPESFLLHLKQAFHIPLILV